MKKVVFLIIASICILLALVFILTLKKPEEQKSTFKGPVGQPSVRGPFGPPPAQ